MKFAFFADEHFRSVPPVARADDYIGNQDKLLSWIEDIAKEYTIISAGDTVHVARERAKPLDFANYLIKKLPHRYGILGNHDLLYHNLDLIESTTMGNLINAGKFTVIPPEGIRFGDVIIYGYSYGQDISHVHNLERTIQIALYHGYVGLEENPMIEGKVAENLLVDFPEYDIIITGDNHQGFVVTDKERILINPGSLKKDNADQTEHTPMVYTFDTEMKKIDYFPVPDFGTVLVRDYLEKQEERNERIENLSSKFKEVQNISLDFEENLHLFCEQNKVDSDVHARVLEWIQ